MTLLTPFKPTPLGLVYTLVSLVCVAAAFDLVSLWITTLTGFPIFRHGKAGPPQILGVLTQVRG